MGVVSDDDVNAHFGKVMSHVELFGSRIVFVLHTPMKECNRCVGPMRMGKLNLFLNVTEVDVANAVVQVRPIYQPGLLFGGFLALRPNVCESTPIVNPFLCTIVAASAASDVSFMPLKAMPSAFNV